MKHENIIQSKSFDFAVSIVEFCKQFANQYQMKPIQNQLLRSGTSIGANVEEAIGGLSPKDFLYKMTLAYKEARETRYWLRLIKSTEPTIEPICNQLIDSCDELLRIIGSIQKSMKEKL